MSCACRWHEVAGQGPDLRASILMHMRVLENQSGLMIILGLRMEGKEQSVIR